MEQKPNEVALLISGASDYLRTKLGYAPHTIERHRKNWYRIRDFMAMRSIRHYGLGVEEQVLFERFKNRSVKELTRHEKEIHNSIRMLTEFFVTGQIKVTPRMDRKNFVFNGAIGALLTAFIEYKRTEQRLSTTRLLCYRRYLYLFMQHCNKNSVLDIVDVDLPLIFHFIGGLDCGEGVPVGTIICTVRNFMKYAFDQGIIKVDHSLKIPRPRSVGQPKLPSTYSKQEIEQLIGSIERSGAIGKRNYAIVLIAARLGLRASDISRLRFNSIKWESSTLEIMQVKTGRQLVLPLLPDVGNAIIEYLRYARPESGEPYVFLTEKPPYAPFQSSNVVTHVVQRAFRKAGIATVGKKFGPHSLRHSLGFRMLEQHTALPVMSEVLGHENTESTRYYLRIDLASMQQCMLDAPPVTKNFYQQREGGFYA